jgi:glycosyltransferase involved in cell wall biosynthesis
MCNQMTDRPLVTIVTPSFNQGRFIEATILSVLDQDYPDIEYIVMDGGSTDGTQDILRRYEGRFAWVSERDGGQSDAIHRGFLRGRGSILAWMNSDDTYEPGAVSAGVAALASDPDLALVYGDAGLVDAAGADIGGCDWIEPFDLRRLVNDIDFIVQPATFFTRSAYLAVGGLDLTLNWVMDYDLWIKLGSRYPARYVPGSWAKVRIHDGTKTGTGGLHRLLEIERMIAGHGRGRLPTDSGLEMLRLQYRAGKSAIRSGKPADAVHALRRGLPYLLTKPGATATARYLGQALTRAPRSASG